MIQDVTVNEVRKTLNDVLSTSSGKYYNIVKGKFSFKNTYYHYLQELTQQEIPYTDTPNYVEVFITPNSNFTTDTICIKSILTINSHKYISNFTISTSMEENQSQLNIQEYIIECIDTAIEYSCYTQKYLLQANR